MTCLRMATESHNEMIGVAGSEFQQVVDPPLPETSDLESHDEEDDFSLDEEEKDSDGDGSEEHASDREESHGERQVVEKDSSPAAAATLSTAEDSKTEEGSDPAIKSAATTKKKRKRRSYNGGSFRKAPQAPKRFKSSYIYFSMARMDELKKEEQESASGSSTSATETLAARSKRVADEWRHLPQEEKKKWEEIANQDKLRYQTEKAMYTGPWQVPSKRKKKDPSAPKRPMSAFLFFSQGMRQKVKEKHPNLSNKEVSKVLGDIWKKASDAVRQPFVDREAREREQYKADMGNWRSRRADEEEAERKRRDALTDHVLKGGQPGPAGMMGNCMMPPGAMVFPPMAFGPAGMLPSAPEAMVGGTAGANAPVPNFMPHMIMPMFPPMMMPPPHDGQQQSQQGMPPMLFPPFMMSPFPPPPPTGAPSPAATTFPTVNPPSHALNGTMQSLPDNDDEGGEDDDEDEDDYEL